MMLRRNKWEKRMTALMVNEIKHKGRRSLLYAQSTQQVHYPAREIWTIEYNTCQEENGVLQAH